MNKIIAIDPDLDKSGVALVIDGKLIDLWALTFVELIPFVVEHYENGAEIRLEDVEANKPTFKRKGVSPAGMRRIAQNVGQVKGTARLLKASLEHSGVTVNMVKPLTGTIKIAKKNAKFFNSLTGWKGSSNEDKRDAALIALFS